MTRTRQLGPRGTTVVTFAGGSFGWVYFPLAAGSRLKNAKLAIATVGAHVINCESTFIVYDSYPVLLHEGFLELKRGYVSRSIARSKPLTWSGDFEVPADREYTLEMELHNMSNIDVPIVGTVFIEEVEPNGLT